MINELDRLHEEYVLVPADKACNNIVFVCKAHYYNCILNELVLTPHLVIVLTLLLLFQKTKFFIIMLQFWTHLISQSMGRKNMNYRTYTGSQNFIKTLTNKDISLDLVNVPPSPCLYSSRKYWQLSRSNFKHITYCETTYARIGVNQM